MNACLSLLPLASADGDLAQVSRDPVRGLAGVLLVALILVGVGCLLGVLRIVFPGPADRADRAVARLGSLRLLVTGVLPLLGMTLLAYATQFGGEPAEVAFTLVVLLPAGALTLLGASALVPHVGGGMLGRQRSLLVRAVVGAVVLGLAFGAAAMLGRQVGISLFALLVLSWFFSAGLGAVLAPRDLPPAEIDDPPEEDGERERRGGPLG